MIINTGARTDTAQWYAPWLLRRFEEGYVLVRNPLFPNKVSRYELDPAVVDCVEFRRLRHRGQRAGCGCFESRDIGAYDSCPNGCRYCYANRDHAKALDNYLHAHDPESPLLLGHLREDDEVSQAPQRSLLAQGHQLSLGI